MLSFNSMKVLKCFVISILIISCSKDSDNVSDLTDNNNGSGNGNITNSITYQPDNYLKDIANFPIGNVVSVNRLNNSQFTDILKKDFNSITAEWQMKMRSIFNGPDNYNFSHGNTIVNFAKNNNIRVFGHALIWHESIPDWLQSFQGSDEEFEELIENYIKATVTHFAKEKTTINGQEVSVVAGWDVVNEAFTTGAENAIFRKKLGSDYVEKCFRWAREADPNVKLFYNDYSLESNSNKTQNVISLVNDFKSRNIPIDGIGLQMHTDYLNPSISIIEANVQSIINLGLLVHFSELDITVNKDRAITTLTYERARTQELRFKDIVTIYSNIPNDQKFGITVWGIKDDDSWLLNHHNNQNEYPLLMDKNYNYKIAHRGFAEGLK